MYKDVTRHSQKQERQEAAEQNKIFSQKFSIDTVNSGLVIAQNLLTTALVNFRFNL